LLGFFKGISEFLHLAETEATKSFSLSHNILSFSLYFNNSLFYRSRGS
jgi:hypothetical protein